MPVIGPLQNVPAGDHVSVELLDAGKTISTWKTYSFDSDFLTPVDSWQLEVADEHVEDLRYSVQNAEKIALKVNGNTVGVGYVDQINVRTSSLGTSMVIRGRDVLSVAADSCVDPLFKFPEGTTIKDFLQRLFAPFGFKNFIVDDDINLKKLTGTAHVFTTNEQRQVIEKQLNTPINNKFKSHPSEGYYEWAERIGRRYGYHLWASADGKTLTAGRANFSSRPPYKIIHRKAGNTNSNNIIESQFTTDWSKQPSIIIAEGSGGGGHFKRHQLEVMMVNELLSDSDAIAAIQKVKKDFPKAHVVPRRSYLKRPKQVKPVTEFAKILYTHDDESKTPEQLSNYVRRMMAEFQSKFLTATYVVPGHSQNGVIWTPNTMVTVIDEVNGIEQDLWIKARKFTKSREGGTKTELECILPHTLEIHPT